MTATAAPPIPSKRLLAAAARAASIAVVANSALYVAARLAGAYPSGTILTGDGASGAPSIVAIVAMSTLASLTAAALVALLVRIVPRPGVVFLAVAASVFAGFVVGPLTLNAPLATMATLELMHLVVATAIVVELMRAVQPRLPADGPRPQQPRAAAA